MSRWQDAAFRPLEIGRLVGTGGDKGIGVVLVEEMIMRSGVLETYGGDC